MCFPGVKTTREILIADTERNRIQEEGKSRKVRKEDGRGEAMSKMVGGIGACQGYNEQ